MVSHCVRSIDAFGNEPMKTLCLALFTLALVSDCDREGPAERAGEAVDRTVEYAGDKIENATDRK